MEAHCSHIAYKDTGYFSKITIDYLNNATQLQPFFQHQPTLQGILNAIQERKNFATNRNVLVSELTKQYEGITLTDIQKNNLQLLLQENTFTITTAHQPNIFTGPLYFIYKILHVIKLAEECNKHFADYQFVPVYYMGSEDADLDELGFVNVGGEKLVWQTNQSGAVGRMKIDKNLLTLINNIQGQIGIHSFGNEFSTLLKTCYTEDKTIQQATLEFVNILFNQFGLIIIIADTTAFKKTFEKIIVKELQESFSNKALQKTVTALEKYYKVQAGGRDINLFYLQENGRDRIEKENDVFTIKKADGSYQNIDIGKELKDNIQAFSPNVILRGVFQETILPNVAFVGGGGELAYWLELKDVFNAAQVPYPALFLRNSFLLIDEKIQTLLNKLSINTEQLFQKENLLVNEMIKTTLSNSVIKQSNEATQQIHNAYTTLKNNIQLLYPSLAQHTEALQTKALHKLKELDKKIIRAEKRKQTELVRQIATLKQQLFPKESLQERTDNIAMYYAKYGADIIHILYQYSLTTEQQFTVLSIKS
ncbi:MAG: bacillithiol biosynthesis cysteine-adding enzyme BshC [Chitinophagaceae bacterium]|nr:bacillithiol biosynthesis cysteine-adding enzyme BshC [Chitinophagaceae bacterium]MCW5905541.1 bacillithiol biosynthesis cysteine-adding enzyme BshC [Chitinophagaceae bacterium]